MPLINLIQEQRFSLKRSEAKARTLFLGFVGVTAVSVVGFGFFWYQTDIAVRDGADLTARAKKLEPIVKRIEADESEYAKLSPRVKTLEDAQAMTDKWIVVLEHLSAQTPRNTWLTGIRCTAADPTKPIVVNFLGLSDKQELVGEYIMRLQNCPELENVALKFTQEKVVQQGTGIEFEISSEIVNSVEEKEKPKEEKSS